MFHTQPIVIAKTIADAHNCPVFDSGIPVYLCVHPLEYWCGFVVPGNGVALHHDILRIGQQAACPFAGLVGGACVHKPLDVTGVGGNFRRGHFVTVFFADAEIVQHCGVVVQFAGRVLLRCCGEHINIKHNTGCRGLALIIVAVHIAVGVFL